jgi:hypothetical protein
MRLDLTGSVYGQLTVVRYDRTVHGNSFWVCRCSCGNTPVVRADHLKQGRVVSCGCRQLTADGHAARLTPTYHSWHAMRARCRDPKQPSFPRYGGRGITVCERWNDFRAFLADMGERPAGTTLDRFPNQDGNYEPGNCRWATPSEQRNNVSTNRLLTVNGETLTVAQWAERIGVRPSTLDERLRHGWTAEDAVTRPVRRYR